MRRLVDGAERVATYNVTGEALSAATNDHYQSLPVHCVSDAAIQRLENGLHLLLLNVCITLYFVLLILLSRRCNQSGSFCPNGMDSC